MRTMQHCVMRMFATWFLFVMTACGHARVPEDVQHCGGTGEEYAAAPKLPGNDCRSLGCAKAGDTCVTDGCNMPWRCEACTMAFTSTPKVRCGCDGKDFVTDNIGCKTKAYAHEGACQRTPQAAP